MFGRRRLEPLRVDNLFNVQCRVEDEKELRRGNRKSGGVVEGVGVGVESSPKRKGKLKGRRKEKKAEAVPEVSKVGTGGLVIAVPLGVRRDTFRCLLANPGGSVPAVVKGVIEMSIWPTRSRARIDLSNSLVEAERGVSGASIGGSWS